MQRIEALFEDGVLRPLDPIDLEEHQHVTLLVLETQAGLAPPSPRALRSTLPVRREQQEEQLRVEDEDIQMMLGISGPSHA